MDTKKVLEKLLKIAENQQKIIMKLAQEQGLPPDTLPGGQVSFEGGQAAPPAAPPPPTGMKPTTTVKVPQKVFWDSMTPQQRAMLASGPEAHGDQMKIRFKPGQKTQANYNSLFALLDKLTKANHIQQAFKLVPVD